MVGPDQMAPKSVQGRGKILHLRRVERVVLLKRGAKFIPLSTVDLDTYLGCISPFIYDLNLTNCFVVRCVSETLSFVQNARLLIRWKCRQALCPKPFQVTGLFLLASVRPDFRDRFVDV
jgi:hypothetical protein